MSKAKKMWYNMNKFINWRRKDMAKWAVQECNTHNKERFTEPPAMQHEGFHEESEASKEWYEPLDKRIYPDYKFNEGNLINEFKEYVDATYNSHYSQNGFQSTEIIVERGHGTGFCMGNIDKYSNRYGKKGNKIEQRKDLVKIMHYALIQLHIHDNNV